MADYICTSSFRVYSVERTTWEATWLASTHDNAYSGNMNTAQAHDKDAPGGHAGLFCIERSYAQFDTTAIPEGSHIQSVTLHLYMINWGGTIPGYLRIVKIPEPGSIGYGYLRSCNTVLGSKYVLVGDPWEYHSISLDVAEDFINCGGYTHVGFRCGRDIDNSPPGSGEEVHITWQTCHAGVLPDDKPYLAITATHALEVETLPCTAKTSSGFTANGEITYIGESNATQRGFTWGLTEDDVDSNQWVEAGSFGVGTFSYEITGLDPETTYYFQAFAEE
jgi:hypothetical protein